MLRIVPSFVKSVTFDCHDPLVLAAFWASALGSNVDEDSTSERAWVEPAGWGGPRPVVPTGSRAEDSPRIASTSTCASRVRWTPNATAWSDSARAVRP